MRFPKRCGISKVLSTQFPAASEPCATKFKEARPRDGVDYVHCLPSPYRIPLIVNQVNGPTQLTLRLLRHLKAALHALFPASEPFAAKSSRRCDRDGEWDKINELAAPSPTDTPVLGPG